MARCTSEGLLEDDDYSKFLAASGGQNLTVDLNSPGGSLLSALQMGAYVRDNGYSTLVRDESTCASACALLWLAGRNRVAGRRAAIGFHAASVNGSVVSDGNAVVGAYLSQLGLSLDAVVKLTQSSPDDMYWLKLNDAKALGIDLYVKDGESVQHQPVTTYQPRRASDRGSTGVEASANAEGSGVRLQREVPAGSQGRSEFDISPRCMDRLSLITARP